MEGDVYSTAPLSPSPSCSSPQLIHRGEGEVLRGVVRNGGCRIISVVTFLCLAMRTLLLALILLPAPARAQELLLVLDSPGTRPESDDFGRSLAAVSDLDGDGISELVVGAPSDEVDGLEAGRVYVFSGADGTLLRTLDSPSPEAEGSFGHYLAAVEDVDGDGYEDLIVGATEERGGYTHALGYAYVFSGATGALLRTYAAPSDEAGVRFGYAVTGLPDLDGDGHAEHAVGAPYATGHAGDEPGYAYVYSGSDGTLIRSLTTQGVWCDLYHGDGFAIAITGVPDADEGGLADVLVGAPLACNSMGAAYLFSGESGAMIWQHEEDLTANRVDHFGQVLVGMEDATGDGRGDYYISTPQGGIVGWGGSPWFTDARGKVSFFAGMGDEIEDTFSPNGEPFGAFGWSLAGLGDIDGDGLPELLAGAPREDPGGSPEDAGRAYVFSPPFDLRYVIVSPADTLARPYFGTTVSAVPAVDGEGRSGFLVTALRHNISDRSGRVYLFSSAPGALPALTAAPLDPPVVIPPEGGSFEYEITLTSQSANPVPQSWEVWTAVTAPDGEETVYNPVLVSLAPGQTMSSIETKVVPAPARPGEYVFTVYLGHHPLADGGSASFTFTKAQATATEPGAGVTGVALHPPRPNPASSRTVIAFELPRPSHVRLAVYDVLGREVAVLVDGALGAGAHEAVLDGASLPVGTYAVRLEAAGQVAARRVTLVR
ncbi:MAG TPA: FG-GAP-like repeat-containing protein [Rubricoccaceae bacterium]|nr:FG-GAP-like repeat-containing protein [Rubricoccaceae bacterium]